MGDQAVWLLAKNIHLLTLITLTASIPTSVCQPGCDDPTSIKRVSIGDELAKLECTVGPCSVYKWFIITNGVSRLLNNATSKSFTIAENITSAMEVGGKEYMCQCEGGNSKNFTIWVNPKVMLTIEPGPQIKAGTSANVTCTAESFPPANSSEYYAFQHPNGTTLKPTHSSPTVGGVIYGVIHPIVSAISSDDGEYDCVVIVKVCNQSLVSDRVQANLTVFYDPPCIKTVRNFTTSIELNDRQSAFLECEVENLEPGLTVWVDWVPVSGTTAGQTNITRRDKYMFFLVLYNITKEDALFYECQLFSERSPDTPLDQETAEILMRGPHEGISTQPCDNGNKPCIIKILFSSLIVLLVGTGLVALVCYCWYTDRKKRSTTLSNIHTRENRSVDNPTYELEGASDVIDTGTELPTAVAADGSDTRPQGATDGMKYSKAHTESNPSKQKSQTVLPRPRLSGSKKNLLSTSEPNSMSYDQSADAIQYDDDNNISHVGIKDS